jgi:hypothetical protein
MDFSRIGRWHRALLPFVMGAVVMGAAIAVAADADDAPGFDRPGIGFATDPLHAGQFAYEQGLPDWSRQRAGGVTSDLYAYDSLLRLGLGGGTELQLGGTLYNRLRQTGQPAVHGRGDTTLGFKWVPVNGEVWSWGLLGTAEFTDGAAAFRNDRPAYTLGLDVTQQPGGNVNFGYYAQWQRSGGKDSLQFAPSIGYQFDPQLSGYAEAAAEHDAGQGFGSAAGAGLAWQPLANLQFDGWFRHRLGGHAPIWEAGVGVAMFFGR